MVTGPENTPKEVGGIKKFAQEHMPLKKGSLERKIVGSCLKSIIPKPNLKATQKKLMLDKTGRKAIRATVGQGIRTVATVGGRISKDSLPSIKSTLKFLSLFKGPKSDKSKTQSPKYLNVNDMSSEERGKRTIHSLESRIGNLKKLPLAKQEAEAKWIGKSIDSLIAAKEGRLPVLAKLVDLGHFDPKDLKTELNNICKELNILLETSEETASEIKELPPPSIADLGAVPSAEFAQTLENVENKMVPIDLGLKSLDLAEKNDEKIAIRNSIKAALENITKQDVKFLKENVHSSKGAQKLLAQYNQALSATSPEELPSFEDVTERVLADEITNKFKSTLGSLQSELSTIRAMEEEVEESVHIEKGQMVFASKKALAIYDFNQKLNSLGKQNEKLLRNNSDLEKQFTQLKIDLNEVRNTLEIL